MKAIIYLVLLFSLLFNLGLTIIAGIPSLMPLIPLVAVAGTVFGAFIIAIVVTTEWQQRVTEKQIQTQIVIAEWNHLAAIWREEAKGKQTFPPLQSLQERMIASGIFKRTSLTNKQPFPPLLQQPIAGLSNFQSVFVTSDNSIESQYNT